MKLGIRYKNWTVISDDLTKRSKRGHILCQVQCDCGAISWKSLPGLMKNKSKCCAECKWKQRFTGVGDLGQTYFKRIQYNCIRRSRNVDFDLTIQYLWDLFQDQNGKCALSGIDISLKKIQAKQTASLDRIASDKGYVAGNVQWVHKDVNQLKGSFDQKTFIQYCKLIANHD